MPPRFQSALHRRDELTYLQLSGIIDEDNDLSQLADRVPPGTLVVDVGAIERINSCGVRDWVNWLGKVEKVGAQVVLVECAPSIVAQINLVNNFTGAGVVKSFYAPYFCPQCDREKLLLIETRDAVGVTPYRAPSCRCDDCDGPMDFDDMEDSYFAFLSNAAKLSANTRLDDVVAEFTPSDASGGPRLRTRSGSISNPGGSPMTTPSSVSGSFPSIRRTISGNHPVVTPAMAAMAAGGSSMSAVTGQQARLANDEALSSRPAPPPPATGKGLWAVLGLMMAAALGLAAWLFLSQGH